MHRTSRSPWPSHDPCSHCKGLSSNAGGGAARPATAWSSMARHHFIIRANGRLSRLSKHPATVSDRRAARPTRREPGSEGPGALAAAPRQPPPSRAALVDTPLATATQRPIYRPGTSIERFLLPVPSAALLLLLLLTVRLLLLPLPRRRSRRRGAAPQQRSHQVFLLRWRQKLAALDGVGNQDHRGRAAA